MMANTLFLRLEGPLQSWGERGRWSIRDTAPYPTKSGVVGLLACALGYNQDEPIRQLSQQIEMGVRIDKPGVMIDDYHTVGGGYDTPQLLTAEGKAKKTPGGQPHTEITERAYLHDASFLVAVRSNTTTIEQLANAVQNPHWVIYLGRKSCPPSRPLFEGVEEHTSVESALQSWNWYKPETDEEKTMQKPAIVGSSVTQGAIRQRHEIISRSKRLYGHHYLQQISLTVQIVPAFPPFYSKQTSKVSEAFKVSHEQEAS
ncbi:MAG: type I-E CRISPR-associated protein Cas5/CasD [Chloroflexi bacterium]|nr:type I-E CRISPR-associated protein Cas5/CasD [Chloroflexota bacterium]